jgi:hypothetical protein
VFYHGEEVATRIRYDSRLLLAHLARLDRLAEQTEVSAALHEFDDAVEALRRGEDIETSPDFHALRQAQDERSSLAQDSVPSVPSCRTAPAVSYDVEREAYLQRVADMDYARPGYAKRPRELAEDHPYLDAHTIEAIQLHAFEDGEEEEWWLVIPTAEEWAALAEAEGESANPLSRLGEHA